MSEISLAPKLGENILLNGLFDLWQRNTAFVGISDGDYGADRFSYGQTGTMVQDLNRSTDVPADSLATYSAFLNVTTAQASIGAGDFSVYSQKIEGYNLRKIKGRNAVLSFRVKAPKAGIYCVSFQNGAGDRSYVTEYTVDVANTWETKVIRMKHDPTGAWNYDASLGMGVFFVQAAGSNFHTIADSWQSGGFLATSNQVNAVDTVNNEFRITQVQFHEGISEIPFEKLMRSFDREIELCQRYFEKGYDLSTPIGTTNVGGANNEWSRRSLAAGAIEEPIEFKVRKRVPPIGTLYSPITGNAGFFRNENGAIDVASSPQNIGEANMIFANFSLSSGLRATWFWSADSEL